MKKYSSKYTDWLIHFIVFLVISALGLYGLITSLNYEKKFAGDLDVYLIPALYLLILLTGILLTTSMLSVVINGTTGIVVFEKNQLTILKGGRSKTYSFNELNSIEFVNRSTYTWRYDTERGPLWYSFCRLKFSNETVILTALNIENQEIAKNINLSMTAVKNRERKIFELIR